MILVLSHIHSLAITTCMDMNILGLTLIMIYLLPSLNTSTENTVNTTMTSYMLRAEYNDIIKVSNKAVNCAGTSEVASATVSVGMKFYSYQ